MRYNLPELKKRIATHLPELVGRFLPYAVKQSKGWRVGDLQGNKGTSLWISDEGTFFDHNTRDKGGILDLMQVWSGAGSFVEMLEWAAQQVGYTPPPPPKRNIAKPQVKIAKTLSQKAVNYIQERGLDGKFVYDNLPIKSLEDDSGLAILHNNEGGDKCHLIKFFDLNTKRWTSSKDPSHILWPMDYIATRFPNETQLLIITEGHWDAIAYLQLGIPAVSIPSGVTNDQWLDESFDFIASFEEILLSYDDKEGDPGREGAARVASRLSALIGPPRIIETPSDCKDANDVLKTHGTEVLIECIKKAKPYSPPEILSGESLIDGAVAAAKDNPFQLETPFEGFPFHFRDHEMTLYTGYTGHGKSNLLRQIIAYLRSTYHVKTTIASFEEKPEITSAGLLLSQFGREGLENNFDTRDFLSNIHIYNTTDCTKKTNDPEKIIDTFTHMHNRWGVTQFVIDNLMTLSVGKDDYEGQINVVELFRQFVQTLPVHLHVVAHPRKPPPQSSGKVTQGPDPYDISGASEIPNLAWNILSIYRNIKKEREKSLTLSVGGAATAEAVKQMDISQPDAILTCHKQRTTGTLPSIKLWYKHSHAIFVTSPDER